mmetsp:Transcript_78160/g.156428  ORF Transcript_78160/g.156428 Transcript_78160/m.156428 type:complete len:93 (-) Transcript_78160:301-579(-)
MLPIYIMHSFFQMDSHCLPRHTSSSAVTISIFLDSFAVTTNQKSIQSSFKFCTNFCLSHFLWRPATKNRSWLQFTLLLTLIPYFLASTNVSF